MTTYYVNQNAQANGDHEVHTADCRYVPTHRIDLGQHWSCATAVSAASRYYPQVNGCVWCSTACHTQ